MTLAITANVILGAIVFTAVVGLLGWTIRTSPTARRTIRMRTAHGRPRAPRPSAQRRIPV
jgi:hypothetical protein